VSPIRLWLEDRSGKIFAITVAVVALLTACGK
jgi:hypothetical protein